MFRFVIKIFIYFSTLGVLTKATTLLLPEDWENMNYVQKESEFLHDQDVQYNTLFFGSSRTYRHVDPISFDSLNALDGFSTRSYMLASSSTFLNENLLHINSLLEKGVLENPVRFLFLELDCSVKMSEQYLHTPRTSYFVEWKSFGDFLQRIWSDPMSFRSKVRQTALYFSSAVAHMTEFGHGHEKLKELLGRSKPPEETHWYARKGFSALDYRLPTFSKGNFKERHELLLSDTTALQRIYASIENQRCKTYGTEQYNISILDIYIELESTLQSKGIQIIFILPLKSYINATDIALYNALPTEFKIDMSSITADIPELRYTSYWFDPGHLNNWGAQLYTRALSREWLALYHRLHGTEQEAF
jgi:hypothetical protein